MVYADNFKIGTAWLSSARVVECSIYLLNERNLLYKFQIISLLKIHILLCLTKNNFIYLTAKLITKILINKLNKLPK